VLYVFIQPEVYRMKRALVLERPFLTSNESLNAKDGNLLALKTFPNLHTYPPESKRTGTNRKQGPIIRNMHERTTRISDRTWWPACGFQSSLTHAKTIHDKEVGLP
jgi:hypothetical protein